MKDQPGNTETVLSADSESSELATMSLNDNVHKPLHASTFSSILPDFSNVVYKGTPWLSLMIVAL